jgi:hypothetical protein
MIEGLTQGLIDSLPECRALSVDGLDNVLFVIVRPSLSSNVFETVNQQETQLCR